MPIQLAAVDVVFSLLCTFALGGRATARFFPPGLAIDHVIVDRVVDPCSSQYVRDRRSCAASEAQQDRRKRVGARSADGRVQLRCNRRGVGRAHARRLLIVRPEILTQPLLHLRNHGHSESYVAPRQHPERRRTTDRERDSARRRAAAGPRVSVTPTPFTPQSVCDPNERSIT